MSCRLHLPLPRLARRVHSMLHRGGAPWAARPLHRHSTRRKRHVLCSLPSGLRRLASPKRERGRRLCAMARRHRGAWKAAHPLTLVLGIDLRTSPRSRPHRALRRVRRCPAKPRVQTIHGGHAPMRPSLPCRRRHHQPPVLQRDPCSGGRCLRAIRAARPRPSPLSPLVGPGRLPMTLSPIRCRRSPTPLCPTTISRTSLLSRPV